MRVVGWGRPDAAPGDTAVNKRYLLLLPLIVIFLWADVLLQSALRTGGILNWVGAICMLVGGFALGAICFCRAKKGKGD